MVSDLPKSTELKMEQISGDWYNLTCSARDARPQAIITWYMNSVDVTAYAYNPRSELDSNGENYACFVSTRSNHSAIDLSATCTYMYVHTCR